MEVVFRSWDGSFLFHRIENCKNFSNEVLLENGPQRLRSSAIQCIWPILEQIVEIVLFVTFGKLRSFMKPKFSQFLVGIAWFEFTACESNSIANFEQKSFWIGILFPLQMYWVGNTGNERHPSHSFIMWCFIHKS